MRLVLASQSPYRRAQLSAFGFEFTAAAPAVDEEGLKASGPRELHELTCYLAERKAASLTAAFPGAVILGSDQLAACDGERLDKPGTPERAFAQLRRLSGREHELITSLAVLHDGRACAATEVTRIRMRPLSDEFIRAYLAVDKPYDCAGAFKIERAGMALIEAIEGRDPSAVQGLPLLHLTECLYQLGLSPHLFWSPS